MIAELWKRWRPPAPPGRFWQFTRQYGERCRQWPVQAKTAAGARVGIVVTPWMQTATPFFSLECARALATSGQAKPVLLWDEANVLWNAADPDEVSALRSLKRTIETQFETISVADEPATRAEETDFIERLLYENSVRQQKGEAGARELAAGQAEAAQAMRVHAGRIAHLLNRGEFEWLLVPGGVWGVSGLWLEVARQRALSFTTFDSGPAQTFLGLNGPCAHFPDVAQAFRSIEPNLTGERRAKVIAEAHAAMQNRRQGGGDLNLQPPIGAALAYDLLVPLNYRSDTAAMERHRAFASVTEWLEQLLTWAAKQPKLTIALRQHPCERIPQYRGSDRWTEILAPFTAQLGDRLRFIPAEEPINSYDLLPHARVVLPWTSRTGLEAAMLGRPVVLGTHCYYMGCGFTEDAATPGEYFAAIERALAGPTETPAAPREAAALIYYLIERCLSVRTSFSPQPDDFTEWVTTPPAALWADPKQKLLLEALLTRQSVAFLQHAHRS